MLQKVLAPARPCCGDMSLVVAHCAKQLECWLEVLTHLTHRCEVPASVAVVRGTPDGSDVLVVEMIFVALVD